MAEVIHYIKHLKPYARQMRNNMTRAEKTLWYKIRCRQLHGARFCRQKPIESYILDFYCKNPKIAIEIDGPIHATAQAQSKDLNRDYVLSSLGIKVLRFKNEDIFNNLDAVIKSISNTILQSIKIPAP